MSTMVAYPTGSTAQMFDTTSLNGGISSSTSGCQSSQSVVDEGVERSRSSSPISLGAFSSYIGKNGGQLIPNRIFVCGFGNNTSDEELRAFFDQYGTVKDVKVISDKTGSSKGYGFITFENEEDAKRIIKDEQNNNKLNFKDRTLNIGPAVKREVARSGTQMSAQLNQVLASGGVVPAELAATGPALFYQSPAALTQVLVPSASYPAIAMSTLGMESSPAAMPYAAYSNPPPLQYAVIGGQMVNYSANPVYACAPAVAGSSSSPFIDHKYVQSVINGTAEMNSSCGNANSTPMGQNATPVQAVPPYAGYPQASLSQMCAASNPNNDMMYYGRHPDHPQYAYQQLSQANSLSSIPSSIEGPYASSNNMQQQQQIDSNSKNSNVYSKSNDGADDSDLAQTLSSLNLGNCSDASNAENQCPDGSSSVYQQTCPPQMYNSMDLVQAAAAAAAAWTYQQNYQNYTKSMVYNNKFSPQIYAGQQQPYGAMSQMPYLGNAKGQQTVSSMNPPIRHVAAYK